VPLAIWIMRGFIVTIPEELEHAREIDGATRVGAMFRVVLPLAAPGLAATATLSLPRGLEGVPARADLHERRGAQDAAARAAVLRRARRHRLGAVMATSVIYTLPVVIFFLLLRKRLMLGMTAGAVKG
jgi:ABC-type glycerol-3-phosphate transport system permease component